MRLNIFKDLLQCVVENIRQIFKTILTFCWATTVPSMSTNVFSLVCESKYVDEFIELPNNFMLQYPITKDILFKILENGFPCPDVTILFMNYISDNHMELYLFIHFFFR